MKNWFWLLILFFFFVSIGKVGAIECSTSLTDNCTVSSNTVLSPGTYNINDVGANGVIIVNASNIILDCNGVVLQGSGSYGIILNNYHNVTIKNCNVTGYFYGIFAYTHGSTISNNIVNSNSYGIYLSNSHHTTLSQNTMQNNQFDDLYIFTSNNLYCNNTITNNTGSGSRPIKYFNYTINLQNETLSELILCNADHSNVENVTITGAPGNNGMYVFMTENSNITGVNSSHNRNGVHLFLSHQNRLNDSILNYNNAGIQLSQSHNNTLVNNTANMSYYGIWLYNSSHNNLVQNTADRHTFGLYIQDTASTNNTVWGNRFCYPMPVTIIAYRDIYDGDSNWGDNNVCGVAFNWNDTGTIGCTYSCAGTVECGSVPTDDCRVSSTRFFTPTTVAPWQVNDSNEDGVLIVNSNDIIISGLNIRGNGSGIGIYNPGFNNITIKNCQITNYEYAIVGNSTSNMSFINNTLCPQTNSSILMINSTNYTGSGNMCEGIGNITDPGFGCRWLCGPTSTSICAAPPYYRGCACADNDTDGYYSCLCPSNVSAGVYYSNSCLFQWPDCDDSNANLHRWVGHTCMGENCTPIVFNGNTSDKIDVVFAGSGFNNLTSFNLTVRELIDYNGAQNGLMSVHPFSSNKTRFNFWMVNTLQTYTNAVSSFRTASTNHVQTTCPFADEKILLLVTPKIWDHAEVWGYYNWSTSEWVWTDSGSFGAYITVGNEFINNSGWPLKADYDYNGNPYPSPQNLSYNKNQVKMQLIHEFGHSFGGLFDEYAAYNCNSNTTCSPRVANPPLVANCALSPCNKWSNITTYCSSPCGYLDWCSSSSSSIMRSIPFNPPVSFNTVSTNELIRDMSNYTSVTSNITMGIPSPSPNMSYVLPLNYTNGNLSAGNLSLVQSSAPSRLSQPSTGYSVQLVSVNNIIYSFKMALTAVHGSPSPDWFDESGNQIVFPNQSIYVLDPYEFSLLIPYFSNAKKIKIYDPAGELVTEVRTSKNIVPVANANGPYEGDEGSSITFNASSSYDPDGDALRYRWDFDSDDIWDTNWSTSSTESHSWTDNGIYTVKLNVSDGELANTYSTTVTVLNLPPIVGPITAPTDPVQNNTEISASADFKDPGIMDTHTAEWNWGDGSTSPGTVDETDGSGTVTGNHNYTKAGVYTITLSVTDDDGSKNSSVFEYIIVYDPEGGFVTGGGWIDSPAGAYADNPSLTGKAKFGFVSKYKKGANTPTGQTQFVFKVADFNFHSSEYQWLVIAGADAKYKGDGFINGEGDYGFMITATDGDINGGGGTDKFRIKIWDKDNNDDVVYDNKMGEDDDSYNAQEIGGGSIVIHK